MTICKTVLSSTVASHFRNQTRKFILETGIKPTLVGFLANQDPAAKKYAEWTERSCRHVGIDFKLEHVDKLNLEKSILKANTDLSVNGIMVYYPVFGDHQDLYLQNRVDHLKDVEGLGQTAIRSVYQNRALIDDNEKSKKTNIPCTPLAIIKILEYIGEYKPNLPYGSRLEGVRVTIINRSEIVGRPLAALLANEGAVVFSVDANNVQEVMKYKDNPSCKVTDSLLTCAEAVSSSDIVITGVPTLGYKVPTEILKPGVIAINFSTFANFDSKVVEKAKYFVPSVGKATVAMLERNLLRLFDQQKSIKPPK